MKRLSLLLAAALLAASAPRAHAQEEERPPHPDGRPMPPLPPLPPLPPGVSEPELIDFVKSNNPEMADHLAAMKQAHPAEFQHKLRDISHMYADKDVREHFVRQTKLQREVRDLAQAYRKAKPEERSAAKDKLTKAVGLLFDADLSQKELQVKKMRSEIAKLEDKVAKRRELKAKIVQKRIDHITGEGDDWEW
ncbi:MAG: hypothetical protein HY078_13295 [Elusimicrobia bacterium]|nr:hypothetical protein [Elusimicrobiota bacterium]